MTCCWFRRRRCCRCRWPLHHHRRHLNRWRTPRMMSGAAALVAGSSDAINWSRSANRPPLHLLLMMHSRTGNSDDIIDRRGLRTICPMCGGKQQSITVRAITVASAVAAPPTTTTRILLTAKTATTAMNGPSLKSQRLDRFFQLVQMCPMGFTVAASTTVNHRSDERFTLIDRMTCGQRMEMSSEW